MAAAARYAPNAPGRTAAPLAQARANAARAALSIGSRRPVMRAWFLAAFSLGVACSADRVDSRAAGPAPVAVFVVRHMEKASSPPEDPELSEAGRARAEALARLLSRSGASRLFATEWKRTQQTLAPLAERSGARVEIVPAGRPEELMARLLELPTGATAVVAGHSNTIPDLVRRLGGRLEGLVATATGESLPDPEYGRVVLLVLPPPGSSDRRALRTLELHVGD
jgi:phosphohistidine phosphatase SixA